MFTTLIVFQVLVAIGLIAIVLVQRGPGATMGAAFGAGASGTVFGSRGAGNFLTRTTGWLAVAFFGISLSLAVLATHVGSQPDDRSVLDDSVIQGGGSTEVVDEDIPPASMDEVIESFDAPAETEQAGEAEQTPADEPAGEPADPPEQG